LVVLTNGYSNIFAPPKPSFVMPLFTGNDLDNILTGSSGDDTIQSLSGNVQLNSEAGNDSIEGGMAVT
jgi:Ca2+-binding RTX toxin-like protein